MPTYHFTTEQSYTVYETGTYSVEADSESEARDLAENAYFDCCIDWDDHDSDNYELMDISLDDVEDLPSIPALTIVTKLPKDPQ